MAQKRRGSSTAKTNRSTMPAARSSKTASKNTQLTNQVDPFLVVGLGASAGGIEALKAFFTAINDTAHMAFVVIQHLDPDHESLLADVLGTCTAMPVVQIKRRMLLEAGHVYVAPPNKYINIHNGSVSLTKVVGQRGMQMPINHFLKRLAEDQHEAGVGIIFSGMGADGANGLRDIKEHGGLSIVQDPLTTGYDAMPSNAINTGMADYILPIPQMPKVLESYATHPYVAGSPENKVTESVSPDDLTSILSLMRTRLKRDFRYYKKSTLLRRITRRMGIVNVESMGEYLTLLRKKQTELENLFNDLLIGVTQFFRDAEAFEALDKQVIASIVHNRQPDCNIRVWVPGCSSGEEAYSVAMLLIEAVSAKRHNFDIQVFATDIDAQALERARAGVFPLSIEADISPERLKRFFILEGKHYRASKQLRETIAFAEQNLISDPPFSRLDLICCRNLMIYIEPELQRKIISLFHYTLEDDGYLLLGSSETVGRLNGLFLLMDKKSKIYKRLKQTKTPKVDFPIVPPVDRNGNKKGARSRHAPQRMVFSDLTHRLLSEAYAPASVLINRNSEPLYFFGPTDRYLKLPLGDPHQDILAMAREGLVTKLRGLINKAVRNDETVKADNIAITRNKKKVAVSITVRPVREPHDAEGLYLIAFSEDGDANAPNVPNQDISIDFAPNSGDTERLELERELQATREDLRSTIEEMETSNEELKAANEEAMSMNEELQSTNEELETSKEEMQSLNEELNTVNMELQDKVDQLEISQNDISNLLSSTEIGTLFLDKTLCIKRFTPAIRQLFTIQAGDEGRKLSDFSKSFHDTRLAADCKVVFETLKPIDREVPTEDNKWFVRRILPYLTNENRIEGVVITFTDVTQIKKAEAEAIRMAAIIRDSNDAVTLQGMNGQILSWNKGAVKMYGYSEKEALTMNIRDLVPKNDRAEALDMVYEAMVNGKVRSDYAKRIHKKGHIIDVWYSVTVLRGATGKPDTIATTERDVTDRLRMEDDLRRNRDELETRVAERTADLKQTIVALQQAREEADAANAAKSDFISSMSHELRTPLNGILGYSEAILNNALNFGCDLECAPQVRHIFNAGTHLHALINDILDIAAIEAGKMELYEEDVVVSSVLESSVRLVASQAKENGVSIRVSTSPDITKLFADERRLKQILINLISNAVKFCGPDKTVRVRANVNKKGEMTFRVADKGRGMDPDGIALALEPFGQVGKKAELSCEGTGLGLPISKQFAEAHGGKLSIRSKPGKGTAVTVSFPPERVLP